MDIDSVRINFDQNSLWILNLCLGFLMFGVALDLKRHHFKYLWRNPKPALVGLTSQLLLLPLLTLALIYCFQPPASMAMGMAILAACPGGNVSNFAVHLAKANSALSIMLTSVSTIGAVIITPTYFMLLTNLIPDSNTFNQSINLDPMTIFGTIFYLLFIPLTLGMVMNRYLSKLTNRIKRPVKIMSILIFFGFIVVALFSNLEVIAKYLWVVFLIVLIHNTLALSTGYYWSKMNGLSISDSRAIALETGIQNSGLGLIIALNFFEGLGGMAMIVAWWGIWHLVSAFVLATWWSRREVE